MEMKYGKKNEIKVNPLAYNLALIGESGIGNAPAVVPENDTAYPPTTSEGNVPESEGSVERTQEPRFEGGTESVPPTSQEGDMSNEPLFIYEGDMLSGM